MGRLCQTDGLTDDQQEILKAVRQFVEDKVMPVATELEHADEYPTEIVEGLKELGIFGLMIPEEYDGLGESLLTYALCVEEIARGWMSVSGVINTHFIVAYMLMRHGTEEQKRRYLPQMAAGEIRGAFSMSEPGMGSDVSAVKTKAVPVDGGYEITGQKMWLTNGGSSNLVAVLARTDEDAGMNLAGSIGGLRGRGAGHRQDGQHGCLHARGRLQVPRRTAAPRSRESLRRGGLHRLARVRTLRGLTGRLVAAQSSFAAATRSPMTYRYGVSPVVALKTRAKCEVLICTSAARVLTEMSRSRFSRI